MSTHTGLFAGPEGPMIHIGALVGAGLSQFKSDSMGIEIGTIMHTLFIILNEILRLF